MPIVQLPDHNKPYLLFRDMSKFCYSVMLTQASTDTNENYFTDSMGTLHKKIIDFTTFSSVVIPKILIKYLLHTSHDSLGHIGVTGLYHFLKRLYYFQGM